MLIEYLIIIGSLLLWYGILMPIAYTYIYSVPFLSLFLGFLPSIAFAFVMVWYYKSQNVQK